MNTDTLLSIIGAFLVLALGINGFFLRGIFRDLNNLRVDLAKMYERAKAKEKRIQELEDNEKDLFERINKLEKEI